MNRSAATALRARLEGQFRYASMTSHPVDSIDKLNFDRPDMRTMLPPPTFGVRQRQRDVDDYEPVMAVPQKLFENYEDVRLQIQRQSDVYLDMIGYARAVAAAPPKISIGRLNSGVTGSVCVFVSRSGDLEALTCHHVLTQIGQGANAGPIGIPGVPMNTVHNQLASGAISTLLPLVPGQVNAFDAGLVTLFQPHQIKNMPPPVQIRPDLHLLSVTRLWGWVSGETACEVDQTDFGVFPIWYDDVVGGGRSIDLRNLIRLTSPQPFSKRGDSGGLLWESGTGLGFGMLVAVAEQAEHDGTWAAYASPLADILSALKATAL
jgi:hypothetical protein